MTANAGNNETRTTDPFNLNGIDVFYTKNAFPTGSMTILSINYYDTYPSEAPAIPTTVLGQYTLQQNLGTNDDSSTMSYLTASYLKNVENDNWTKTFTYYDSRGRIIATKSTNHLGGYTNKDLLLDFTGEIEKSITYHKRLRTDTEKIITETFEYDNGEQAFNT